MKEESAETTRPVRVPGAARLEEGFARKLRFPREDAEGLREIVVCRVDGRLFAVDSLCPHEGGRISEGPLAEGRYLTCPLHLYKFDPRSGQAVEVECDAATRYRIEEVGEDAEIWVDEPQPEEPQTGESDQGSATCNDC